MADNLKKFIPALVLLAVCTGLYSHSLSADFFLDDHLLKQKPQLQSIADIPTYFTNPLMGEHRYRPLSDVVRAVLFQFFKFSTVKYRLFNLFVFYFLCVLVYYFVRRLTANYFLSLMTSVLFCIHSVNTTLVQYVWNLDTTLATIFIILSSLVALDYFYTQSWKDCLLSLIFYILAILFSEISIIFPMYLVLFTFYIEKNRRELKVYLKQLTPFIVVSLLYFLFRQKIANFTSISMLYAQSLDLSVGAYIASLGSLILWYASKIIFPYHMLIIWNIQPLGETSITLSFFFLMTVVFLVWKVVFVWKKRVCSLALIWFLSGFLPLVLGMFIMPFLGLVLEPHWFVFPSIGAFLLISWGFQKLQGVMPEKAFLAFITTFLAFHCIMTTAYNHKWKTEKTYCEYWAGIKPDNYFANNCLASAHFREGNYPAAKKYLNRSLVGNSMDWQVYSNLGYIEYLQGHNAQAGAYYQKALTLNPEAQTVKNNLELLKK